MKKALIIIALTLISSVCFAGTYEFEDSAMNDPSLAICVDMMANLKALGEPPMVCDRKFHPKFRQFSWPKWRKLDPWENRDLIYQIWDEHFKRAFDKNNPYAKDDLRAFEATKFNFRENIASDDITLAVTDVIIDGKPTGMLQFIESKIGFPCKQSGYFSSTPYGRQHYFVDMKTRKVNFEANYASWLLGLQGHPNNYYGDIFLYKGVPYAAFWDGDNKKGMLVVKGGREDYCAIEYEHKTGQSSKNGALK
jgi:hypothetical protein